VNRKKSYLLIAALLFCSLVAAFLFNLPGMLRHQLEARLAASGFELQSMEVASVSLNAASISGMKLRSAENGLLIKLRQIQIGYQPAELLSGYIESLEIGVMDIHLPDSGSHSVMQQLRQLQTLLDEDWRDRAPVRQATVAQLAVFEREQVNPLLSVQLHFSNRDDLLQAKILLFLQQQQHYLQVQHRGRGEWLLEATDKDQQPVLSATLQLATDSPLTIKLHSDIKELRAWGALFQIPFPPHQAQMDVTLSLAPDFDKQEASFVLDGKAERINDETLQLQRAELSAQGEIQLQQDQRSVLVDTVSSMTLYGLKRGAISSDKVQLNSTAHLTINDSGLQGVFDSGLQIHANKFNYQDVLLHAVDMKSTQQQQFSWESSSGWIMGGSRVVIDHQGVDTDSLKTGAGSLHLKHGEWRFPLTTMTPFEVSGHLQQAEIGEAIIEGIDLQSAGKVLWRESLPVAAVHADVDLRMRSIIRGDVSFQEACFTTRGEVEITDGGIDGQLDAGLQLQSDAMQIKSVSVQSSQLKSVDPQLFSLRSDSDNSDTPWSVGENRFEIEHQGATSSAMELAAGSFELKSDSWSYPLRQSLSGEIKTPGLIVTSDESPHEFGGAKGSYEIDGKMLTLQASSSYKATATLLSLKMQQSLQQGSGSITFNSKPQSLEKLSRSMKQITAEWPRDLVVATGTATMHGSAAWDRGLKQSRVDIKVSNAGGRYVEAYFSGLNTDLKLDLYPEFEGRAKKISVKLIDIGVPINDLTASLRLDWPSRGKKPTMTFSNLKASLLKGRVTGKRVRIDLNRRRHDFTLALHHIDIAEIVRLHGFEGLKATGKVSGNIPVRLGPKGVSVRKGRIRADKPGGTINYVPDERGEALKSASVKSEILLNLLRDFRYDVLDAETEYKTDGQLLMKMQLRGKSPQQYKDRPVHLNLTLDQNILSLLKSLRSVNGVNERIDRKVRQSYKH